MVIYLLCPYPPRDLAFKPTAKLGKKRQTF